MSGQFEGHYATYGILLILLTGMTLSSGFLGILVDKFGRGQFQGQC